ncbi:MAG: oxidoreductase [Anaeromyxobacteraceae bacterium]
MGGVLLRQMLDDPHFSRVISVGRRQLPLEHPKLTQVLADFTSAAALEALDPPTVAFSCLGTTIGKAGSRDAFRAVDHGAVLAFARAARKRGASVVVHVSSVGADLRSRAFYLSVKGELERDVTRLAFPSTYALRPSMLDGVREERRPAEQLGLVVARALGPILGKYRPTKVEAVARVMIASAKVAAPGSHVIEPGAIR